MGKANKKNAGAKTQSKHARRLERCRLRPVKPAALLYDAWTDPPNFSDALQLHMQRHRESAHVLWRAITRPGDRLEPSTIVTWRNGSKSPRTKDSLIYLQRIEERYGLEVGYFAKKLPHKSRATARPALKRLSSSEQRRLAWHLPNDFESRPRAEQDAILSWVQEKVMSGATDYRRYQAAAVRHRYAIRFRGLDCPIATDEDSLHIEACSDPELRPGRLEAPPELADEMRRLIRFKTATLAPPGYMRRGVWRPETAAQKIEHLGLMFGALSASPRGAVQGFGLPITELRIALLAFPQIWDWYVDGASDEEASTRHGRSTC